MNTNFTAEEWQALFEPEQYIVQELETAILTINMHRDEFQGIEVLPIIRRNILNNYTLKHQAERLPFIIEFNDILKKNLQEMYNKTLCIWNNNPIEKKTNSVCRLEAYCYLDGKYPALHPFQTPKREELWEILTDSAFNSMYCDGVAIGPLTCSCMKGKNSLNYSSFDDFIGLTSYLPNWREGLDPELTKDLHLICPFYHLFAHTYFALTDFLYVR